MNQKIRIKLKSYDHTLVDKSSEKIVRAVKATGAEKVFTTHGFQSAFSRYLNEEKIALGAEVKTQYGNEDDEAAPEITEEKKLTSGSNE